MDIIITAVITTAAIGLLAAIVLTIASKLMYVRVDPKVAMLRDALPGANCGACGFSGCDGYAEALAKGEATADLCPPGGEAAYKQISGILGTDAAGGLLKKTAIVCCAGDSSSKTDKMEYIGIATCLAAEQLFGGPGACSFGCLGFGDCARVCPGSAICVDNGLARIDRRKCTGCGICISACPRDVIAIITDTVSVSVLCRNSEKGAVVRKKCTKGCIACTKCVKECPESAIEITDNLAVIDSGKCSACNRCAEVCMTGCLVSLCPPPEAE